MTSVRFARQSFSAPPSAAAIGPLLDVGVSSSLP